MKGAISPFISAAQNSHIHSRSAALNDYPLIAFCKEADQDKLDGQDLRIGQKRFEIFALD